MRLRQSLITTSGIEDLANAGATFKFVLLPNEQGRREWLFVATSAQGEDHVLVTHATIRPRIFKSADTAIELCEKHVPHWTEIVLPLRPDPGFDYGT